MGLQVGPSPRVNGAGELITLLPATGGIHFMECLLYGSKFPAARAASGCTHGRIPEFQIFPKEECYLDTHQREKTVKTGWQKYSV